MEQQARPMQALAPEAEKEADVSVYAEGRKQDPTVLLALHFGFIMLLYMVILFTFPIDDLSNTHKGLTKFLYDEVEYKHSNGEIGRFQTVHTLDDVVAYSESLLKSLLSETSDVGRRSQSEQHMLLGAHRLINSVVLVQRRVAPGKCSGRTVRDLHDDCYEEVSSHELTFGTQHLKNGVEVPYSEALGGFAVEFPLNRPLALDRFEELKDGHYWDRGTRDVSVLFGIHNSPGQYTGNVRAEFVLSPYGPRYGSIRSSVDVDFFRLLPYDDPLQGCLLIGLQAWAIIHWLVLVGLLARRFVMQPHVRWRLALALEPWTVLELMGNVFILYGMYVWYGYLHDPRRANADFGSPHYQDLLVLGDTFQTYIFCLSAALVLWAARLVQFVQAFRHKQARVTVAIVESVFEGLFLFGLVFGILLAGFLCISRRLPRITDLWNVLDILALWLAAVSDGRRDMVDITGGPAFFLLFVVLCFVLLLNMFLLMVMEAQERVAEEQAEEAKPRTRRRPLGHRLSDAICDFLGIPECEAELYDIEDQKEDPKRFGQILDEIGWLDARG